MKHGIRRLLRSSVRPWKCTGKTSGKRRGDTIFFYRKIFLPLRRKGTTLRGGPPRRTRDKLHFWGIASENAIKKSLCAARNWIDCGTTLWRADAAVEVLFNSMNQYPLWGRKAEFPRPQPLIWRHSHRPKPRSPECCKAGP